MLFWTVWSARLAIGTLPTKRKRLVSTSQTLQPRLQPTLPLPRNRLPANSRPRLLRKWPLALGEAESQEASSKWFLNSRKKGTQIGNLLPCQVRLERLLYFFYMFTYLEIRTLLTMRYFYVCARLRGAVPWNHGFREIRLKKNVKKFPFLEECIRKMEASMLNKKRLKRCNITHILIKL